MAAISQHDTTFAEADQQPLESALGSSTRLKERKAILDQQVAAAVARGGRVTAWWGRGSFEAVVLLVTVPITPLPVQGELAAFQAFPASVNLVVLKAAWRQLEVG